MNAEDYDVKKLIFLEDRVIEINEDIKYLIKFLGLIDRENSFFIENRNYIGTLHINIEVLLNNINKLQTLLKSKLQESGKQ